MDKEIKVIPIPGVTLSDDNFTRLSRFIEQNYGIKMPLGKKILLEARLHKRLKALNLKDFDEYCSLVFSEQGVQEIPFMIDNVSTNKTEFFREKDHFEFLYQKVFPSLISESGQNRIFLWSAGCSTGEEPYSLAFVCQEYKEMMLRQKVSFDYGILGTDISNYVLKKAEEAVYTEENIGSIPAELRKKYLLRNKFDSSVCRISPKIREKVFFHRLNLMEKNFPIPEKIHVIFCRNVMIYFKRETQINLISHFIQCLVPEGFLLLGHSESIINMNLPLKSLYPGVYKKTDGARHG